MTYKILLMFHLLGASIWVGGHLILSIRILPAAWKNKDIGIIQEFESRFENLGLPALLLQVITGIWLAFHYLPHPLEWFTFKSYLATHIFVKLALLFLTVILAIHARLFLIPKPGNDHFSMLAIHILGVTTLSVAFLIVGVGFRTGGIF